MLRPAVQVVKWQVVPRNVADIAQQLAVTVDQQRKAANQVVFGRFDLGLRRAAGYKVFDYRAGHSQRLCRLVGPGLQTDGKRTSVQAWRKITGYAIGQASLFTHFVLQARHKTATTQNVVAHQQWEERRVIAFVAGLAHQDLGLGGVKGDILLHRLRQRRDLWHWR